ncbi:MAG TPA: hypothetical protein VIV60_16400 [Polyangiaceae bacterium]
MRKGGFANRGLGFVVWQAGTPIAFLTTLGIAGLAAGAGALLQTGRVARPRTSTSQGRALRLLCAPVRAGMLLALVFLAVAGPRFAFGQGREPNAPSNARLRAMVWLPPETEEVLARVRGQTNDLAVDLVVDTHEPLPGGHEAQLQIAYSFSERREVTLVIWFVKQPDADRHFVVNIAIPSMHRLLTRDLGPSNAESGGIGISSAVKEGAALVVRAAIQAVLNGSTIGDVHAAPVEAPIEAPAQRVTPAARSSGSGADGREAALQSPKATPYAPEAPQSDAHSRGDWPWAVGLELFVPYDGVGNNGIADCGSLRLERLSRPLLVFVMGGGCVARNFRVADGTVSVGRQQAAIGANAILWDKGLQLSAGVQVGAVFYERKTLDFPLGTSRASRTHALGVAGPEFRLIIPPGDSRLSASLTVGVDLLSSPVIFSYRGSLGLPTDQANRVQPYASLGLAFWF